MSNVEKTVGKAKSVKHLTKSNFNFHALNRI